MVKPSPAQQQRTSYGSAKRLRQSVESVINTITIFPNTVVMMTVVCDDGGERFAVGHPRAFQDPGLAEMQAIWLKDQFIWDHITFPVQGKSDDQGEGQARAYEAYRDKRARSAHKPLLYLASKAAAEKDQLKGMLDEAESQLAWISLDRYGTLLSHGSLGRTH